MRNILLEQKFPDNRKEGSTHRQAIAGGLFLLVNNRIKKSPSGDFF